MPEPEHPLVGQIIDGRYRVVAALGRGGMGDVFRAEQISLKREVALKLLRSEIADDPEAVARFEREALALSRLDHPNVVRVIDFGRSGHRVYLVMELVAGRDLGAELAQGALAPQRVIGIVGSLCDALGAAHAQGIVHRDLKPGNVILSEGDLAKVLDFGVAVMLEGHGQTPRPRSVLGTPEYMSPEQALGRPLDARSDLYSLGVLAYQMLSNQLPFSAPKPADFLTLHVNARPLPLAEAWPAAPQWPALGAAVMRALEKDPSKRFADAAEMRAAVQPPAAPKKAPPAQPVPALWARAHRALAGMNPRVKRALPWAVAGLAVSALAVGIAASHSSPYGRAERDIAQRHPDEALAVLEPLLARTPPPARALDLAGRALEVRGDLDKALQRLRDANASDADFRGDLVRTCQAALATPASHGKCPIRQEAMAILVAINAHEADKTLKSMVASRSCGAAEAQAALKAMH